MVEDYINKKNLAKMGFHFSPDNLTDFEVSCFNIIGNKFKELEIDKMKQKGEQ
jgi:hypothetical protein